jgi:RNA polymerase sigma factor (sigma-70 family)
MKASPEILMQQEGRLSDGKMYLLEDPKLRSALMRYAGKLCFQAGLCESDAEDVVQNTYFRATKYIGNFQIKDDVSTRSWFYKILFSVFCDFVRKKKHEKVDQTIDFNLVSKGTVSQELRIESKLEELSGPLKSALDKLDIRYFVAFWLVVVEGMPQDELATQMGTTRVNVAKLVFRSKEVLRRVLKDLRE